ncbi:hypothetical protein HS048_05555 [Planomonospora sp. ID91781]|uniref:hypothetical protein n=1 Tax=Planomonospora sp. ID91781 TaxID=2738135 RepID=UPI0018C38486|nr:hypothetical protein [Planomonospora sp. ID91781]MBG0820200.1 hypothetical protein [Planomonospora sp. ID91781]
MGRHRSDPMGIARLALAGLAVLALLFLIALGGRSLIGALGSEPASSASASAPAPATGAPSATPARVPTVLVECVEERCPTVFLKVAGGDVLLNREMARGEQAQAFDDKVDVVLTDASTVRVRVNGVVRPPGGAGERQEFTAVRE